MNAAGVILAAVVLVFWALGAWSKSHDRRIRESGLYPPPGAGTDDDVWRLADSGEKISAIKLYREIHNVDLRTSKVAVEALVRSRSRGA